MLLFLIKQVCFAMKYLFKSKGILDMMIQKNFLILNDKIPIECIFQNG